MTVFEYHETGRDPFFLALTALGLCFLPLAYALAAPWWTWAIWGPSVALLVWRVILNPKAGMVLGADHWHYYGENTDGIVALADIAHVYIKHESDGPDGVVLVMTDGTRRTLPRHSYPATHRLTPQLEQRAIKVQ